MDRRSTLSRSMTRVLVAAIRSYQLLFSQFFTGSCRFVPSCSCYAREAVERHGPLKGSWLSVKRLARCHPLCEGGLDQVPGTHPPHGT